MPDIKEMLPFLIPLIIAEIILLTVTLRHIFTHKKWFMNSYYIELKKKIDDYLWLPLEEIENNYAIPTAFMPFVQYLKEK